MWLLAIAIDIPLRFVLCLVLACCKCTPPYHKKHVIHPVVSVADLKRFSRSPMKNRDPLLDGLQPDDLLLANHIGQNTPR